MLVDHRNQLECQHSIAPAFFKQRNQSLLNERVIDYRPTEGVALARIVASLQECSVKDAAGVGGVVHPRSIDHKVHQRLEAVGRFANRPRGRLIEIHLSRWQGLSAQLVFQPLERNVVDLAIRQHSRHKEDRDTRCAGRRPGRASRDQEVLVGVRAEPLLAGDRPCAVWIRLRFSFNRANVRTAVLLGDELRTGERRID